MDQAILQAKNLPNETSYTIPWNEPLSIKQPRAMAPYLSYGSRCEQTDDPWLT